jgi:hypothetical protein
MAHIPNETDEGVPLRLYYDLDDGHTANAEVIARATLAFVAGVRELSYVLDPSATVNLGIKGYADGSLWEDLLLLVDKAKAEYEANSIRYGLALAAIGWLLSPPFERARDIAWEPFIQKYMPDAADSDVAEAKRLIDAAQSGRVALAQKQRFYREVGRDTGIKSVSVNIERRKPAWAVTRAEFPAYSGQQPTLNSELDRTTVGQMRVIILSPVLEVNDRRRWKFATAQGEFGAAVKDKAFLETIVSGRTAVKMRGGVEMDVELETKERLIDGVWTITERNVLHVIQIEEPAVSRQGSMFPGEGDDH